MYISSLIYYKIYDIIIAIESATAAGATMAAAEARMALTRRTMAQRRRSAGSYSFPLPEPRPQFTLEGPRRFGGYRSYLPFLDGVPARLGRGQE